MGIVDGVSFAIVKKKSETELEQNCPAGGTNARRNRKNKREGKEERERERGRCTPPCSLECLRFLELISHIRFFFILEDPVGAHIHTKRPKIIRYDPSAKCTH
jgi:hypothetical protein